MLDRIAGAPISWGVCEVPGWGLQLPYDRVLAEMAGIGLHATELGAIGWLPSDPYEARAAVARHGLRAIGGFVPLALHTAGAREASRPRAEAIAAGLATAGATFFVTAVVSDPDDWQRPVVGASEWTHILAGLAEVEEIATAAGLRQVVHPHVNTLVQTDAELARLLDQSSLAICLDTGHLTLGGSDPVTVAGHAFERIGLVHLKDVRASVAARLAAGELTLMQAVQAGLFPPLGDGDVPIAETIAVLERAGYTGPYVLEQDIAITGGEPPAGEGPVRDVARSVAFLRKLASTAAAAEVGSCPDR